MGGRILRSWGWRQGQGIGKVPGIAQPLQLASQTTTTGLGFGLDTRHRRRRAQRQQQSAGVGLTYEEKMRLRRIQEDPHYVAISTVYDHNHQQPRQQAADDACGGGEGRRQFDDVYLMMPFEGQAFVRESGVPSDPEASSSNQLTESSSRQMTHHPTM